jgi:PEP-CTERM motif
MGANMLRVIMVGFMLASIAVASPVSAAIVVNSGSIGQPINVQYNGFVNPDGSTGVLSGLTAKAIFKLQSITGSSFKFSYAIDNTSTLPVTTSRVSIFGFNVSPNVTSASATGLFHLVGIGTNVPNLTGPDTNRVCFRAGGGANQCAGGGGVGEAITDPVANGTFTLNFLTGTTAITLDRFYVRYQTLSTSQTTQNSATGLGVIFGPVPEPSSWAMMAAGFGLMGSMLRRRTRVLSHG